VRETRTIREEIPGMRKMRIIIPITIAVVAVTAFSLTVVLAQENERGDSNASKLAAKVAKILGLDAAEVDDAINQARRELRDEAGQGKKPSWEDIGRKLRSAVESGDITREQAAKILEALRTSKAVRGKELSLEDIERGLRTKVEAGDITQADADAYLKGLKARKDSRRIAVEDVESRLKAAVKEGKITQEQADARLKGFKARAEGIKRGDGSFDVAGAVSSSKVSLEKGETTLDALEARLQSAVKGGRLTQDDADTIMKRLKQ
tara:strand:- start:339 stop:1130 length:792 start_codon:yes stop_codon:yes gene_type:complete